MHERFENVYLPLTDAALDFFLHIHFYGFSIIEFFQCNVVWNHGILSLIPFPKRPPRIVEVETEGCPRTPEELSENIAHVWAILVTTGASEALHTIRVIDFPSIWVIQYLVSEAP